MHNSEREIENMLTALHEQCLEVLGETEVVIDLTADVPAPTEGGLTQ